MELNAYLLFLWRHRLSIGLTALTTLAIAGLASKVMTPVYTASVTLQVSTPARGMLDEVQYDVAYADRLMNTYSQTAQSGLIRHELMERFNLQEPPSIEAQVLANTELIVLTVEADDPSLAGERANALAAILVARGEERVNADLQKRQQELTRQLGQFEAELRTVEQDYAKLSILSPADAEGLAAIRDELDRKRGQYDELRAQRESLRTRALIQTSLLSVMDPATPPTEPTRPNVRLNLMAGLIAGLAAGLGVALLVENLDNRLHSVDQIEMAAQSPLLAGVPVSPHTKWPNVVMNGHSPHEAAFARAAVNLAARAKDTSPLVLLVTSAEPGEGKSTVVANLGVALAKLGHSVILVDCNIHHPSLHTIFNIPSELGISDALLAHARLDQISHASSVPNLRVIPYGEHSGRSLALFTPGRLAPLMEQLRRRADIVLLDTPALLTSAETPALSAVADGIVFVVGQSIAHKEAVERARRELANTPAKLMGIVVSHTTQSAVYRPGRN